MDITRDEQTIIDDIAFNAGQAGAPSRFFIGFGPSHRRGGDPAIRPGVVRAALLRLGFTVDGFEAEFGRATVRKA